MKKHTHSLVFIGILLTLMAIILTCSQPVTWLEGEELLGSADKIELLSTNEGIYPDTSVLENYNNPFRSVYISEDMQWNIEDLGLTYLATQYYMWATVLARGPYGVPQYYTAQKLELAGFTNQAIRGYQTILDVWPDSNIYEANGDSKKLGPLAYEAIEALGYEPQGYILIEDKHGNKILYPMTEN